MAAYLVMDSQLDNPVRYEDYKILAKPIIESYGGEYLARGAAMTVKESDLWAPTRLVLIRFPDMATAERCFSSPEYQAILPISKESARRTLVLFEGM